MNKIKWKVASKASGQFASFDKRSWPSAEDSNGHAIAMLDCEDDYTADLAKGGLNMSGVQPVITAYVCNWSNWNLGEARDRTKAAFSRMRLKQRFNNAADAKKAIAEILERHPEYFNKGV